MVGRRVTEEDVGVSSVSQNTSCTTQGNGGALHVCNLADSSMHKQYPMKYYTYSPATSFAVFPLRSSSLTSITRRTQGCKQAGCRQRQEQRSSPSDYFNSKHFTNSHEAQIYPNPLGVNVSEVFLYTIGVSESP